jgi:hypothetical protein
VLCAHYRLITWVYIAVAIGPCQPGLAVLDYGKGVPVSGMRSWVQTLAGTREASLFSALCVQAVDVCERQPKHEMKLYTQIRDGVVSPESADVRPHDFHRPHQDPFLAIHRDLLSPMAVYA